MEVTSRDQSSKHEGLLKAFYGHEPTGSACPAPLSRTPSQADTDLTKVHKQVSSSALMAVHMVVTSHENKKTIGEQKNFSSFKGGIEEKISNLSDWI